MSEVAERVVNVKDAVVEDDRAGHWGAVTRVMTPDMRAAGGKLGVCHITLAPGMSTCPFHWHLLEDEVFYVLSGRGVLRYGETLREIGPGDCISCPAGTRIAHQLANPFAEALVYLAIGPREPHEVCGYPDSGKIMVRGLGVGRLTKTAYMDGEPDPPRVYDLIAGADAMQGTTKP